MSFALPLQEFQGNPATCTGRLESVDLDSEKELASYSELAEEIAAAQKEIALVQVENWKKEQLAKLNGKP